MSISVPMGYFIVVMPLGGSIGLILLAFLLQKPRLGYVGLAGTIFFILLGSLPIYYSTW